MLNLFIKYENEIEHSRPSVTYSAIYCRILPAAPPVVAAATDGSASPVTAPKAKTAGPARGAAGGPKTALNGMDALCTAAAMMADDETPEGGVVVEDMEDAALQEVAVVTSSSAGDVLTYYCPSAVTAGVAPQSKVEHGGVSLSCFLFVTITLQAESILRNFSFARKQFATNYRRK